MAAWTQRAGTITPVKRRVVIDGDDGEGDRVAEKIWRVGVLLGDAVNDSEVLVSCSVGEGVTKFIIDEAGGVAHAELIKMTKRQRINACFIVIPAIFSLIILILHQ